MRLISCYIENFGLIHTATFNFSKGLNCCISENGTGKTTLAAFIEAMLYGIGDTRRQALDENPRKKYMPWQSGKFGGSLTLEAGKKKYMIERSFGSRPADDTFRLIDADTGRVSEDYGEDIGEKLFGIDRDGFLRTAYLSEKNLRGKNDNKSISAKLSDLVGVDGDVGEFDEAIKLLEERRKFYFKKGNTGEIANVREKINECQRKIDRIAALEEESAAKEGELKRLNAEKTLLQTEEEKIKARLEELSHTRERITHEERYATMLQAVKLEKERFAKVKEFFNKGLPTSEDIDKARDMQSEAERLKLEALSERGNEEYLTLDEFFKAGTSFSEISDAECTAELVLEKEREIANIDNESDARSLEMRTIFKDGAPSRDDVDSAKKSERGALVKMGLALLGIMLSILGLTLGGMFRYALTVPGAIITFIFAFSLLKGRKSKDLLSFTDEYGDKKKSVASIEKKLYRYEQLKEERDDLRSRLSEEHSQLSMKVFSFLGKFPLTDADSVLDAVRVIRYKYTKYYAIGQAGELEAGSKLERLKRSEDLARATREFLGRFPTVTDNPFGEIREKLNEYTYLKASVTRLETECDDYAVKYGVTGKGVTDNGENELTLKSSLAELSERSRELTARIALTEREINVTRLEIDRKDEYEMAKEELEELYSKHVDSLDVIKKTSLYLTEACDNITSKYLGKTKERFEEYSKLIAGVEGEYTLNTSFELMRTERGESHGIDSYSRGIRDLYSLGLRLALIDALYENEAPFIILDDPFIAFDDGKLERAKTTLKSIGKSKQILYFTCAKSRVIE